MNSALPDEFRAMQTERTSLSLHGMRFMEWISTAGRRKSDACGLVRAQGWGYRNGTLAIWMIT